MRGKILFAALGLLAACKTTRPMALGLSGIWPPGAVAVSGVPQATPEQWQQYWTFSAGHAEFMVAHGSTVAEVAAIAQQIQARTMKPAIVVTDVPESDAIAGYLAAAAPVLATADIPVWCVGNEVDGADAQVATRASSVAGSLKSIKPSLTTCTVFQYERVKALSDAAARAARFAVDALAFTTYPSAIAGFTTASSVPTSYYAPMQTIAGAKKILVTEVSWHAASEIEQAAFVKRLPTLAPKGLLYASWFSPFDFSPNVAPGAWSKMGMAGRPAEAEWLSLLAIPEDD